MLQLVSKSGAYPGQAWPIVETPLVFGRDPSCTIRLNDPIVSRFHCRVNLQDHHACLRDMDSRNATLVNGLPVREAALQPGDEIAIGDSIFLVTEVHEANIHTTRKASKLDETSALKINIPIYSSTSGDSLFRKGTPHTTQELVHLFSFGRALSRASTTTQLAATLQQHIKEQFTPTTLWLVLHDTEEQEPLIIADDQAIPLHDDTVLYGHVLQSIEDKRSLLFPQIHGAGNSKSVKTTIVSPVVLGQKSLGALVAQVHSPERIYEESDLEYLIAHAYALAPYVRVAKRLERLEVENKRLVAGIAHNSSIVGDSPALSIVRQQTRDVARSRLSVLILGETGVGKDLVARMVHDLSDLSEKPLVIINCAAIPDELFESEVFGHEKGAFTGAHAAKKGLIEESNNGTLFLDEVGDLSLANQARLLHTIETGSYRRLGGSAMLQAKVRVVAATNKKLEDEIKTGRFRRDLYHRLNGFELHLPALRERRSDIPALAEHFRKQAVKRDKHGPSGFSAEALHSLERHSWPGNVRELRNLIERAMVVAKHKQIETGDLGLNDDTALPDSFTPLADMERQHIKEALRRSNGNVPKAAGILGIGRSTLYRKISEYNLTESYTKK
ncbi:MAG: sigma 54-interacting transcriptional regulator [Candidatus Hydrogenedentes bacterium]|nr:sigma 54-interacting transcriptional regulator [Candidatus Hydrogenedentota bacterium]